MAIIVLAAACGPASATLLAVQGDARDPASGRLLYRENHLIRGSASNPQERVVLYRCADGTAFARKRVEYAASRTAPDFSLVDARDNYREGLRRDGKGEEVWGGGKPAAALPVSSGTLVADAGFDEFLRIHWNALIAQGSLPIRFVVPSFGKSLDFRVSNLGKRQIGGESALVFRLKPGGMLGWIAPDMQVAYAADDHRLLRFTGISNIRDDGGKPLHARIDFPQAPQPVDDAQWQTAMAAPLARCRIGA